MQGALEGVRVIELASYVAGPHCGMILADLGAEVIKIEPPGGDQARRAPPGPFHGETPYFMQTNRNKKSLVLDLKNPDHKAVLLDLVGKVDVVITAYTRQTKRTLGLDFDVLSKLNPRLVFCSVTGFGDTGPYREQPGYDFLAQCISGMAHIHGDDADGIPRVCRLSVTDLTTGVYAAVGIMAALRQRDITGEGQKVDMGILDVAMSYLSYTATNHMTFGAIPARPSMSSHPYWVPCQTFATADSYIYLAILPAHHWRLLCDFLGMSDWKEELADPPARMQNRERITRRINEILATRTTVEWVDLLVPGGIPCAPINDLPTALADPQVRAREMIVETHHPLAGSVRVVGNPIKLSGHNQQYRAAPLLSEHTTALLRDLLNYSEERAEAIHADGCRETTHG